MGIIRGGEGDQGRGREQQVDVGEVSDVVDWEEGMCIGMAAVDGQSTISGRFESIHLS